MFRSHNCGELRIADIGKDVKLSGWIQKVRALGGLTFIDVRDRYGVTQLVVEEDKAHLLSDKNLGREYVISASGKVIERSSKNTNIPTGEIEVVIDILELLNPSLVPPFTIEDDTDGGEELRMKYRYLDLRRQPLQRNLKLRYDVNRVIRNYLDSKDFMDIETPFLIKSTPEGARDFVVPSRIHVGQFYALPQSPQTFKQLLMVSGYDKYYQIVKCFRDEDLRSDRQPEFTQIDCEMSFVNQEEILHIFEGLLKNVLKEIKKIDHIENFPRMTYAQAMEDYGNDKPDIRFGMKLKNLNSLVKEKGFKVFDDAELVVGIAVPNCSEYSRKQLDELTEWVKRPQIGMQGLVYVKCNADNTFKSSVDKFYSEDKLKLWAEYCEAKPGDLILVLAGKEALTRKAMSELRLNLGNQLGFRNKDTFAPLWVYNFPLLDYDEEEQRFVAMHHPFTSPIAEHMEWMADSNKAKDILANAYDLVLNGHEIGGGSIRIYQKHIQQQMFKLLGINEEEQVEKFGFLLGAFEYGAPPHGGIALGFDRLCALLGGDESIRDYIAFPKNNAGKDVMIDTPSLIDDIQKKELGLK